MKKYILNVLTLFIFIFFVNYDTSNNKTRTSQVNEKIEITKLNLYKDFKINGYVSVIKIKKNSLSYKIVDQDHRKYDFYMNANYFTINDKPVGEVKIDGKTIQHKNKNGSYFTSDGNAPTFYYKERPNKVKYSSQTHTPVIMNETPNYSIFNKKWAENKLPRLIIGENKNKDIIVIHTVDGTRCSVHDFYRISKSQGLVNAYMFDGGTSIEVGVKYGNINYKYQIVSDVIRKLINIPTPSVFIVGNFN
jgi:exopolysaccharide biosynthesis protein